MNTNNQALGSVLHKLLRNIHEVEKELQHAGWSKEDTEKYIHGLITREFNKASTGDL